MLVLSVSSDPPDGVEVVAFYPCGGFSFLAGLKDCPPIHTSDVLCSLPSNVSYSEGTILELPQEYYCKYLDLKEKNEQRTEEAYAKAKQDDRVVVAKNLKSLEQSGTSNRL